MRETFVWEQSRRYNFSTNAALVDQRRVFAKFHALLDISFFLRAGNAAYSLILATSLSRVSSGLLTRTFIDAFAGTKSCAPCKSKVIVGRAMAIASSSCEPNESRRLVKRKASCSA